MIFNKFPFIDKDTSYNFLVKGLAKTLISTFIFGKPSLFERLSGELGFSKEHRDINIRRIGYVASEITKNGGIALCAPIAPYETTRRSVRKEIEHYGAFVEIYVATSIEECEIRDRKGLYKLARAGKIKEFTGISDPYNVPINPEVILDTEGFEVDECAQKIILKLESMGLIKG